jgi:hypothetical protein
VGYLCCFHSLGNDFLSRNQVAQQVKASINKWDYMKFKASEQQKKWSKIIKTIHRMGENLFQVYIRQGVDN